MIDKVEHKYYGKYRGTVVDSKDPLNLGRLKLKVPSILGEKEVTGWALPCLPYGGAKDQGFFFIPEKDASVWVEFEAGDLQYPIWVGTFWRKLDGNPEIPEQAQDDAANQRIIRTSTGLMIQLNDKEKSILIEDSIGNQIKMSESEFTITAKTVLKIDSGKNEMFITGEIVNIN